MATRAAWPCLGRSVIVAGATVAHAGAVVRRAQPARHDGRAVADGLVAVLLLAELLYGAGLAAHGIVDRRRWAAWGAEWRAIGPKWSGHA